jgi:hypothetical protein
MIGLPKAHEESCEEQAAFPPMMQLLNNNEYHTNEGKYDTHYHLEHSFLDMLQAHEEACDEQAAPSRVQLFNNHEYYIVKRSEIWISPWASAFLFDLFSLGTGACFPPSCVVEGAVTSAAFFRGFGFGFGVLRACSFLNCFCSRSSRTSVSSGATPRVINAIKSEYPR